MMMGLCICVIIVPMLLLLCFSFFIIQYCYFDEFIFIVNLIIFCDHTIYQKKPKSCEIQFNINMTACSAV